MNNAPESQMPVFTYRKLAIEILNQVDLALTSLERSLARGRSDICLVSTGWFSRKVLSVDVGEFCLVVVSTKDEPADRHVVISSKKTRRFLLPSVNSADLLEASREFRFFVNIPSFIDFFRFEYPVIKLNSLPVEVTSLEVACSLGVEREYERSLLELPEHYAFAWQPYGGELRAYSWSRGHVESLPLFSFVGHYKLGPRGIRR